MAALMLERVRFARYALRFERAFKTDEWGPVEACFADDARYIIAGTRSEFDGEARGAHAIGRLFKRMLDAYDRKFDRRSPRITSWPFVRRGELNFTWSAKYTLGADSVILHGMSRCTFARGAIVELHDTMLADECARWAALANVPRA